MLSNCIAMLYFIVIYRQVAADSVLALPKRIEKITSKSMKALFAVGVPAAVSILLFDVTNMVINRMSSSYGDFQLAAVGIVMKVERLPLNIGVGIGLGMVPLVAYNFASGDRKRMGAFFTAARVSGIAVAVCSVGLYYVTSPWLVRAFIEDAATVEYGIEFLRARCFATPFMFLSFNMVHFMQAVGKGRISFWLAVIRQICLNIPILFLMNYLFGMTGIIHTQAIADCLNVIISYIIYFRVVKTLDAAPRNATIKRRIYYAESL